MLRPLAAGLALLAVMAAGVGAQPGFRVAHAVARTTPTHVEVEGTVQNEARAEAVDISVTVEALGAGGKVLARGITYVTPRLAEQATAQFTAKVPVVSGVTGYRATVTSYRFVQSIQGP
jgi:hypothetical protein